MSDAVPLSVRRGVARRAGVRSIVSEESIIRNQRVTELKISRSRELRKEMTTAENEFWEIVRNRRLSGLKFRRQQIIDGFIVDFYCDSIGLCIEIDGQVHENDEQKSYDRCRDEVLALRNLKIIRITNDDVLNKKDEIIKMIKNLI